MRPGGGIRAATAAAALAAALALWAGFWVVAARRGAMPEGVARYTWIPALPALGADFRSVDHVARLYAGGEDPTRLTGDWICMLYPYPPAVNRLFGWVALVSTPDAVNIWLVVLTIIYTGGAVAAWRGRGELGLSAVPLGAVVAALLYSAPALLAMERGQIDPLCVPALGGAAWLLRGRSAGRELLAGGLLGVAAWLKYYPGVAAVALVAPGRPRALAAFVVVAGLIGVVDRDEVRRAVAIGGRWTAIHEKEKAVAFVHATKHAVADAWKPLWVGTPRPWRYLGRVPAGVAAGLFLVPPVVGVGRRMARSGGSGALIFPYLLWLTAVGTFAMPTSIDYALVPLPLAALAVWDRRDSAVVQIGMALLVVSLQPVWWPVDGRLLFVAKLAGLYAVGASLAARAGAVDRGDEGRHRLYVMTPSRRPTAAATLGPARPSP